MAERTCSVDGCDSPTAARGWCRKHWARWRRTGTTEVAGRERGTPPPPCLIHDCEAPGNGGWGWCAKHYRRYQRHGDPLATSRIVGDDVKRFWSYVDQNGSAPAHRPDLGACWVWTGALTPDGYGSFGVTWMATNSAHRWSYWHHTGSLPADGLELDHLCHVRRCVNPHHMEPVTHAENVYRSTSFAAANAAKTHCPQGHPYSEENTRRQANGGRLCRVCQHEHDARRRATG